MGAHTAPRSTTVARVAGRGALTAAAALALTGGTATFAFAGTSASDDEPTVKCDSSCDDARWYEDDEDDKKADEVDADRSDAKSDDDEDCDDDERGRHHDDWDGKKHDKDDDDHHGKWDGKKERGGDRQFGARYEDSEHNGDDIYTINNVKNSSLLAGVL